MGTCGLTKPSGEVRFLADLVGARFPVIETDGVKPASTDSIVTKSLPPRLRS